MEPPYLIILMNRNAALVPFQPFLSLNAKPCCLAIPSPRITGKMPLSYNLVLVRWTAPILSEAVIILILFRSLSHVKHLLPAQILDCLD
jgi:hypothetical protein